MIVEGVRIQIVLSRFKLPFMIQVHSSGLLDSPLYMNDLILAGASVKIKSVQSLSLEMSGLATVAHAKWMAASQMKGYKTPKAGLPLKGCKLQLVQKAVDRLLEGADNTECVTPLLEELPWLRLAIFWRSADYDLESLCDVRPGS